MSNPNCSVGVPAGRRLEPTHAHADRPEAVSSQAKRQEEERAELQERYDRLTAHVLRAGSWLSSPAAQFLSAADWDLQFRVYSEQLNTLQRIGEELKVAAKGGVL